MECYLWALLDSRIWRVAFLGQADILLCACYEVYCDPFLDVLILRKHVLSGLLSPSNQEEVGSRSAGPETRGS